VRYFAIAAPVAKVRPIEALRDRPVAGRFRREREIRFRAELPEEDEAPGALLGFEEEEEGSGVETGGDGGR
jgi:hypothetical protein